MFNEVLRYIRAALLFINMFPYLFYKLFKVKSKDGLIEFREWIYSSKEILSNIGDLSKLSKYRKRSEQGELFDSKALSKLAGFGVKGLGVISNNVYLNGGGYRASAQIELEAHVQYELSCDIRNLRQNGLRVLGPGWVANIGHSTYLSVLPKLEVQRTDIPNRVLIYSHTANNFFVSLFAKHYSLFRVPENLTSALINYFGDCLQPLGAIRVSEERVLDLYSAITLAERSWNNSASQKSFLQLPDFALEIGAKFLEETKLEKFEWFVALHMREAPTTLVRGGGNVQVQSYIPAIKAILSLGGAVVRLGNPGMTRIEDIDSSLHENSGFFDYANSKYKSEVLDIFLMANCLFMIGTSSGPIGVPKEFGKAVLYTNAPNVGVLPEMLGYCMPNLYQDRSGKRVELSEMLERPEIGWKMSRVKSDFERLSNSPEDIREATRHMVCESLNLPRENIYDGLRKVSDEIRKKHELTSAMAICPTYLNAHPEFLN